MSHPASLDPGDSLPMVADIVATDAPLARALDLIDLAVIPRDLGLALNDRLLFEPVVLVLVAVVAIDVSLERRPADGPGEQEGELPTAITTAA